MQYIHYGTTRFNPYLFTKIVNIPHRTKPDNGFWASPVNENLFTWEKWCEVEGFCECNPEKSITFHLAENARVLYLTCVIAQVTFIHHAVRCLHCEPYDTGPQVFVHFI